MGGTQGGAVDQESTENEKTQYELLQDKRMAELAHAFRPVESTSQEL
jgi:hypothetical protein